MNDYRELNSDEIQALTTFNCCANACREMLYKVQRRLKEAEPKYLTDVLKAAELLSGVVEFLITQSGDEDQQQMIINRMARLKLQFGHVRKEPEELVIMTVDDANTLLSPVLDRCDLECPMEDESLSEAQRRICVKRCETRKALKRVGLSEVGLSMMCPYQLIADAKTKKG